MPRMPWEDEDRIDPTDKFYLGLKAQKLNEKLIERAYERRKRVAEGGGRVGEASQILCSDSLGRTRT